MSSVDDSGKRADLASWQAAEVWKVVLRSLTLVQLGLVIGCLAVPLLGYDENPDRSSNSGVPARIQTLSLFRGTLYYLIGADESFGDTEARPYGVAGGRTVTIVCLFVLIGLLILTVVVTFGLSGDVGRAMPALGVVGGVGLIVVTVALALAQKWLDNSDFATPWQPGLFVPLGTGVWLLSLARARRGWDRLQSY